MTFRVSPQAKKFVWFYYNLLIIHRSVCYTKAVEEP